MYLGRLGTRLQSSMTENHEFLGSIPEILEKTIYSTLVVIFFGKSVALD